ncbi:uncharacterized protein BJ171DRAFT_164738 [Polychytrium aggregatum]|uniref:uncharacterized protein n=1 Tax=Polychytrium aggregatum TaxID=110093 RepID=UPI0022FDFE13|nr:uncharacterized protein BJ171DRAFT_164738 [Polychytrium aggregatum]KAI9202625.1 hypothetical protein BJ171DRAFT_164738 [Polychytrium aggregatum]
MITAEPIELIAASRQADGSEQLSARVLLEADLPSDDECDPDFVVAEADQDEDEDLEDADDVFDSVPRAAHPHAADTDDAEIDEIDPSEINDIVTESLALQSGTVLRSGKSFTSHKPRTILDEFEIDDDEDHDDDYVIDADEDESEDDDVGSDASSEADDLDDSNDVDKEEVQDIIHGHPNMGDKSVNLFKNAKVLRDGKEIASSAEISDLASRIQELMQPRSTEYGQL